MIFDMTDLQAAAYASAVGKLIEACGKAPRERALAALRAFGLEEDQVSTVLEHGLAIGLYVDEPATASLRAPQRARREASAFLGDKIIDPQKDPDVARRLALLRILLSTLPVVMWAVDRAGLFVYFEGKGVEKMGLPEGMFIGQSYHELFGNHESALPVARAFGGEVVSGAWGFANRYWENWCFPIKSAAGEIELVALISLDVSETRQTEQELRAKLEMIERQQRVISELSTPIIEVWEKILALPLVGMVDSMRAAAVMTGLLDAVVSKGAQFILLDLTGVEAVDTATASHMLDLIRAVRLLGAEGIITGIRPSVAETMVALGVDLGGIVTHASVRQGLQYCLRRSKQGAK
jgi:anti-anti-sigma regulatory factor/PAS domain-containing protein